jgi:hypothetical protein
VAPGKQTAWSRIEWKIRLSVGSGMSIAITALWMIIPASSGNAVPRLATKYETYEGVPWHRREPGALVFLLVLLFTPITVALCIIALTGDVYRKAYDEDGNLQVWGPGNKFAAVLILLIQYFMIYAVMMSL